MGIPPAGCDAVSARQRMERRERPDDGRDRITQPALVAPERSLERLTLIAGLEAQRPRLGTVLIPAPVERLSDGVETGNHFRFVFELAVELAVEPSHAGGYPTVGAHPRLV